MSLKQMIDAAEAWANVQRERKLELSHTQDPAPQEAGVWRKGLFFWDQQPPLLTGWKRPLPSECPQLQVGNLST